MMFVSGRFRSFKLEHMNTVKKDLRCLLRTSLFNTNYAFLLPVG